MNVKKDDLREESDSLGVVTIPKDRLWGASTARALEHFFASSAGGGMLSEKMPMDVIYALALVKKCCAKAHQQLGLLDSKKAGAIMQSADEIIAGDLDSHFPLPVWQTGSGTGSNMNVNEVIANRAIQILGGQVGSKSVHPNDDVNKGQSSNDVFPTAMHISAVKKALFLCQVLKKFEACLEGKAQEFEDLIKIGRTHLMDAAPLTLGQEFSGYVSQVSSARKRLLQSINNLYCLSLGGTAVGTGLNAPGDFAKIAISFIAKETGSTFVKAQNLFATSSAHDDLVDLSSSLKTLACSLMKIANDIRLMASGPRAGLNELTIPFNEPGSSIMPGKVNPTQCEALTMVCAEVMGCDVAVTMGGANGHFQLNVFKPLIIFNILRSINLLANSVQCFHQYCISGIQANKKQLEKNVSNSLMLVTALNPHIGYDKAAQIAKLAYQNNITLKKATLQLGFLTEKEFDKLVQAKKMLGKNENS